MKKTVLVIEDNKEIRENTIELLELAGYRVIDVEDGKAGIHAAEKELPDIILCDIMMPLTDGYEVLENLKGNSSTTNIPFIYLTASAEKKEIQKAMDMGASAYICKPFDVNELIDTVERLLQ
ncbi:response regulator [Fulvivirga sp. 29W222]|uniref:Response regulator n=1 Tax=Fulvivirga marina TaxID=2494733 RepID=A0A937G176_9BACT|nr:response regulator [Fulvivirga marina]MBL6448777.1 response regulator [Fulvivirga marina]